MSNKLVSQIITYVLTIGIPALCTIIYKWWNAHQAKRLVNSL